MAATPHLSTLILATPASVALANQNELKTLTKHRSSPTGSFKKCKTVTELKQLHSQITKNGLNHHPLSLTNLISSCTEMRTFESLEYAQKALELFIEDNGIMGTHYMFSSLIRGYSACGLGYKAIAVFRQLMCMGAVPDNFTFPFVLSACTKSAALSEGFQVHGAIVKMGFERDMFVENSLIHFYGECGEIDCMRRVFDKMSERNVVSWTSLIGGYAKRGCYKEAVSLFFEMVEVGIRPNSVTMVGVISACAKLQDLQLGRAGVYLYCLSMFRLDDVSCGKWCHDVVTLRMQLQVFNKMVKRDVSAWTAAIGAMAMDGNGTRAIELFDEMLQRGIKPDGVVFVALLTALSHAGLLSEALSLINSMPMEPNDVIWGSLLAACRVHKNLDIAACAAERISELDPERTGIHVLLSNIYASAGRWDDVAKLEDIGYVPDLTNVLLDVNEKEKVVPAQSTQ
ncbi:hypothetical protein POTOM_061245 [Populus tomentosa]|uniref:Pentatricopeptide repeat-containing protein n=1 Tax=Populus tomentosa TaxID=118781 RepID=A0A8X7XPG1_POPTO|nr:hypothetical protein POTOM_061245 [Populus tomentosa]